MSKLHRSLRESRRWLDVALQWVVIGAVMLLVVVVLWGVFTRFILDAPSHWTEEAARLLLMWVALLGAAVASGRREHLGFDYVVQRLDPAAGRLMAMAAEGVVLAFALIVLVYGGLILVIETLAAGQLTPALNWKMGHVYLALPISGVFMTIYSLSDLVALAGGDPRSSGDQT